MKKPALILILLAAMVLLLSGCKANKYQEAVALYEAGEYSEAYEIFFDILSYERAYAYAQDCVTADIRQYLDAGEFDLALTAVDKYSGWKKLSEYQSLALYAQTAAAGSYIEHATYENCLLSCIVHLNAPIEGQYVELTLSAPKDSNIYSKFAYTTRPDPEMAPETAADYFDIERYTSDGAYVLDKVNIADFTYTLPMMSKLYDLAIFRPETQMMFQMTSFMTAWDKAVSPNGTEGISFRESIDYAMFHSTSNGPVDSVTYAFGGGELQVSILDAQDTFIYSVTLPIKAR